MQVFLTVLAGVTVYVLGQIVQRFVLDPIKAFHGTRAKISFFLLANQAMVTNASNEDPAIQRDAQALAADLIATTGQIPFYDAGWLPRLFRIPDKDAVFCAAREMNGIAHGIGPFGRTKSSAAENTVALRKIGELLQIDTRYSGG